MIKIKSINVCSKNSKVDVTLTLDAISEQNIPTLTPSVMQEIIISALQQKVDRCERLITDAVDLKEKLDVKFVDDEKDVYIAEIDQPDNGFLKKDYEECKKVLRVMMDNGIESELSKKDIRTCMVAVAEMDKIGISQRLYNKLIKTLTLGLMALK